MTYCLKTGITVSFLFVLARVTFVDRLLRSQKRDPRNHTKKHQRSYLRVVAALRSSGGMFEPVTNSTTG
ncbi:MAG TPA: hypothetical protein VL866_00730, partial [Pyrinomonadaceae bacterium]|nr:hypothetical protein [Pyrinomonadaceae bacterium]